MKKSACKKLLHAARKSIALLASKIPGQNTRSLIPVCSVAKAPFIKKKKLIFPLLTVPAMMQSCTIFTFYNPHMGHTPSVKNKNEIELVPATGNTGELGFVKFYALNASYGLRDSQVVSLSGFQGTSSSAIETRSLLTGPIRAEKIYGKHLSYEISYGQLKPLGRHAGCYLIGSAGYGRNHYKYAETFDGGITEQIRMVDYFRTSFSPAFTAEPNDLLEFSIAPRTTFVHFNRIIDNTPYTNKFEETFANLYTNRDQFFFEPYINLKSGPKHLKFYIQYTYLHPLGREIAFRHARHNFSAGIQLNIVTRRQLASPQKERVHFKQ